MDIGVRTRQCIGVYFVCVALASYEENEKRQGGGVKTDGIGVSLTRVFRLLLRTQRVASRGERGVEVGGGSLSCVNTGNREPMTWRGCAAQVKA
jgi:hypothetical protein